MSTLTIYKGQSWKRRLTVTSRDTGLPCDITGASIEFTIKSKASDPSPTLKLTTGAGITILTQSGATLGQADIECTPDAVMSADEGSYVADVVVVLANDTFRHVVVSPIKIPIRDSVNSP
jgi:hypothetical protein